MLITKFFKINIVEINMFFYKKRPELEKEILARTNTFIKDIKNSPDLSKFIEVFGITGPAARGQATHKGSDSIFIA